MAKSKRLIKKSLVDFSKSLVDFSKSLVDFLKSLVDFSKSLVDFLKSLVDFSTIQSIIEFRASVNRLFVFVNVLSNATTICRRIK